MHPPMLERCLIWYARVFPFERGKVRLVNALWRVAAGRSGYLRTANLQYGGYEAPCDLREMLQRQFYFFGTYHLEADLLSLWSAVAQQSQVVFDVGANAGIYSLAALAANPNATVHAFEPTPEIAERLTATAVRNGLVKLNVHECAVADRSGQACLIRYRGGGDNDGMNFISTEPSGGETVEVRSLDDFCNSSGIKQIDLMKIDVQGHEPTVLRGAEGLLQDKRIGTLFIELNWGEDERTCPATEVIKLLTAHGYLFAEPSEKLRWRPAGEWLHELSDVMAVNPDSANLSDSHIMKNELQC